MAKTTEKDTAPKAKSLTIDVPIGLWADICEDFCIAHRKAEVAPEMAPEEFVALTVKRFVKESAMAVRIARAKDEAAARAAKDLEKELDF